MALTKVEKDVLLGLLRKLLFDILYCELKQNLGDATLIEVFKVYCKIKKELKIGGENEQ